MDKKTKFQIARIIILIALIVGGIFMLIEKSKPEEKAELKIEIDIPSETTSQNTITIPNLTSKKGVQELG